eukprot:TRINITY_DN110781_c0_g1_i1.p1 TRINITY_DN110781_c0_g1~~TRINITY_DN110781_c0_g1_i1.p1  ORF type:complete len:429 (+),score=79.90 TRINITY_DN110781_c0_g1_i1:101-1387(+)
MGVWTLAAALLLPTSGSELPAAQLHVATDATAGKPARSLIRRAALLREHSPDSSSDPAADDTAVPEEQAGRVWCGVMSASSCADCMRVAQPEVDFEVQCGGDCVWRGASCEALTAVSNDSDSNTSQLAELHRNSSNPLVNWTELEELTSSNRADTGELTQPAAAFFDEEAAAASAPRENQVYMKFYGHGQCSFAGDSRGISLGTQPVADCMRLCLRSSDCIAVTTGGPNGGTLFSGDGAAPTFACKLLSGSGVDFTTVGGHDTSVFCYRKVLPGTTLCDYKAAPPQRHDHSNTSTNTTAMTAGNASKRLPGELASDEVVDSNSSGAAGGNHSAAATWNTGPGADLLPGAPQHPGLFSAGYWSPVRSYKPPKVRQQTNESAGAHNTTNSSTVVSNATTRGVTNVTKKSAKDASNNSTMHPTDSTGNITV